MKNHMTVFCGSSTGENPDYKTQSVALADALIENDYHLVYGAGNVGLMGIIADRMLKKGGDVIGIIPQHLVDMEVAHHGITELIITESMHERKAIMAERASGFIAMPGGIGTLEEIVEVMTWLQLNLHNKPIAFYNINGYYDQFFSFINHMVKEKFLKQKNVDQIIVDSDPNQLVLKMKEYNAEYVAKWINPNL